MSIETVYRTDDGEIFDEISDARYREKYLEFQIMLKNDSNLEELFNKMADFFDYDLDLDY